VDVDSGWSVPKPTARQRLPLVAVRRRDRSAARKADSVTRPERTAQLRIKEKLAKRLAKKVKFAKLKGKKLKMKKSSWSITPMPSWFMVSDFFKIRHWINIFILKYFSNALLLDSYY
jgi:hypothetical protein